MSNCLAYGVFIVCALSSAYSYEKCTHGFVYKFCYVGSCCKRNGTWYCTYYTNNCDSLAETTTTRKPTEAPSTRPTLAPYTRRPLHTTSTSSSNSIVLPVLLSVGGVLLISILLAVFCVFKRNRTPGVVIQQGIQSSGMNPVHFVNDAAGQLQPSSYPPVYQIANEGQTNLPQNTVVGGTKRSHQQFGQQIQMDSIQVSPPNSRVTGDINARTYNNLPQHNSYENTKKENKWKNGVPSL